VVNRRLPVCNALIIMSDVPQQQPSELPGDVAGRPRVSAVCGASCPGKTTIAEKLAGKFGELKIISAHDFFLFDQYTGDICPTIETAGRTWKDWESEAAIDWDGLVQKVRQVAEEPGCPRLIVVEGFLLMARPESRELFDAAVHVTWSKQECWRRRRSRAESMAHLPPGFSSSEKERNYEVLETYVLSSADHSLFLDEAAYRFPKKVASLGCGSTWRGSSGQRLPRSRLGQLPSRQLGARFCIWTGRSHRGVKHGNRPVSLRC